MIGNKATHILLPVLLIAVTAYGNDNPTGVLTGQVSDASTGEPLAGSNISVIGTEFGAIADVFGRFKIEDLPAGTYPVRISLIGYEDVVKSDVVISPTTMAEVNVELNYSVIQSGEVVSVRPGFFSKPSGALLSVQSQSSEEIRRLPGSFLDVVRATANLPGVAEVQAGRNDLIVRGGAPTENLFIVDDIEVPNINHFGTQGSSGGPLSYINLDFVDNTKFYTGGFGVKYGDRLSSALDIRLRDGRDDRLAGKATISASQFGLEVEGPVGSKGNYLFSARRSYLDFLFRALGLEFVPEYWDFLMKANYEPNFRNRFSFVGIAAFDDIDFFYDDAEDRYENSRRLDSSLDQFVGGVSWRHLIPHGFLTLSAGQIYTSYDYLQKDSLLSPTFTSESKEYESFLRLEAHLNLAENTDVLSGLIGKLVRTKGNIRLEPFVNSYGEELSVDSKYDLTANKSAGYFQIAQNLSRLRVTGGIRVDYFDLIADNWAIAPRLSASLRLSSRSSLIGSMGRYYQAPSLVWLSSNEYNHHLDFVGANQYVGGVEYLIREDTKISLEGYHKGYFNIPASIQQDYIVMSNVGAGFGGSEESFSSFGIDSLSSDGKGRAFGVEIFVQKKLSEIPCYGTVSLSFNKSEYAGIDGVFRPGSYDRAFVGNISGGYIFNERWEIATKFRMVTGRPYTPFSSDGLQDPALYNSERVETNHSLDIRADRRWFFGGWSLTAYIDVQNVYNREFSEVPRYNARTGELESLNELGIFPTIGISMEF